MRRNRLLDYSVYVAVRVLICVIQSLPIEWCEAAARGLATLCCNVLKIRRSVVDENLRFAYPKMSAAARQRLAWRMWEHLFLLITEVAHAPRKIHETNWRDYITLIEQDRIVGSIFEDRPTVIVCGHYGNFELSGFLMGMFGFPSYTIARPLDNPYLNRFINQFRGARGQRILPKNGSAQQINAVLEEGATLVLLGDQHAGPKGCWVQFFGRPASTHKAIALFALGGDAPLVLCYCRRNGRALYHRLGAQAIADPRELPVERLNVRALTQWYTDQLEQVIRQAPEQYWWIHRRWKDTRPKSSSHSKAA